MIVNKAIAIAKGLNMEWMRTSDKGRAFIKREEGVRNKAYKCSAGKWTIGVGHTGYVGNHPVHEGMWISNDLIDELLDKDLIKFESVINRNVRVTLNQFQFDALVSLVFNIGEGNFLKSTLLKELNKGNYEEVINQILRWQYANGKPILLNRRKREARLFERGAYT